VNEPVQHGSGRLAGKAAVITGGDSYVSGARIAVTGGKPIL
jgi:hypothetical protein